MIKRFASIFLTSGIFFMILAFGVAVTAMSQAGNYTLIAVATPNTCVYCHVDVHPEFTTQIQIQSSQLSPAVEATPEVPLCTSCHEMATEEDLPIQVIEGRLTDVQRRVNTLRAQLNDIQEQHPEWDVNSLYAAKSARQIKAERISTLVMFLESDGSWGFHDPAYTEEILAEAETLMQTLLEDL